MKSLKNACAALLVASAAAALSAAPEITVGAVTQDDGRRVTIPYSLAGEPAVVTFAVETNGPAGWARVDAALTASARGDLGKLVAVGDHAITWRPSRDLKGVPLPADGVRFALTAWPTNNPPAYLVINLLPGATDRIRYYEDERALPYGGVLSNEIYRTTSLVLKKVMAKGVTWKMGSISETGRHATYEAPHNVTLDENFYLAVFELTQCQHTLINGGVAPTFRYAVDGAMRPSDIVTRVDCVGTASDGAGVQELAESSICGRLRSLTGLAFNLPGEAQWEFTCRAGCGDGHWPVADGNRPMGISGAGADEGLPGRYAQNGGWPTDQLDQYNLPVVTLGTNFATAVVGSYAPNAWGFYDMCGNVREWCRDWWKADISSDGGAIVAEQGDNSYFAYRGGSNGDDASSCRPAARMMAGENAKWTSYSRFWGVRLWVPCEAK